MPPKRLRSAFEMPLILPAKVQQIFEICKFRGAKNVEEYKKASYFAGSDD